MLADYARIGVDTGISASSTSIGPADAFFAFLAFLRGVGSVNVRNDDFSAGVAVVKNVLPIGDCTIGLPSLCMSARLLARRGEARGDAISVPAKFGDKTPLRPNEGEHASLGMLSNGLPNAVGTSVAPAKGLILGFPALPLPLPPPPPPQPLPRAIIIIIGVPFGANARRGLPLMDNPIGLSFSPNENLAGLAFAAPFLYNGLSLLRSGLCSY